MDWKKLLRSITTSVDEELQLRHAYLEAENRLLRQQLTGRVQLTDDERRALAELGQQLGKQALTEIATVAKAETILAWHHKFVHHTADISAPHKSVGRPRMDQEIEDLVLQMARENRSWGYDRMVGALLNLGYTISDQTVGNILKRHGLPPAPERRKTMPWREFLRIHLAVLGATDFFMSEVWSWLALMLSSMLSVLPVGRYHGPGVRAAAPHTAQWRVPFLTWSLDGHTDRQRGRPVMQVVRAQLLLCAAGVQTDMLSLCPLPDDRASYSTGMGTVVVMPAGHPRPLREGPLPCRPCLGSPPQHDNREAA